MAGGVFDQAVAFRMARINALRRDVVAAQSPRWRAKLLLDLEAERRELARLFTFARAALIAVA